MQDLLMLLNSEREDRARTKARNKARCGRSEEASL